jgi:hypothetical protein
VDRRAVDLTDLPVVLAAIAANTVLNVAVAADLREPRANRLRGVRYLKNI